MKTAEIRVEKGRMNSFAQMKSTRPGKNNLDFIQSTGNVQITGW
jgi:hypothetical protein